MKHNLVPTSPRSMKHIRLQSVFRIISVLGSLFFVSTQLFHFSLLCYFSVVLLCFMHLGLSAFFLSSGLHSIRTMLLSLLSTLVAFRYHPAWLAGCIHLLSLFKSWVPKTLMEQMSGKERECHRFLLSEKKYKQADVS